jgi:lipoprotein-releasing system ATP-binding protein
MLETAPLLTAGNLHKTYRKDAVEVRVLQGLELEVYPGEFLSVVGASGCGKSTLLHLLGTIDKPDKGEIRLDGDRIDNLPSETGSAIRRLALSFSSITCCRNSRRLKMSCSPP